MDANLLKVAGATAGVAGVAIAMLVLVFKQMLQKSVLGGMTKADQFRLLRLIVVGCLLVALAGIVSWTVGSWGKSANTDTVSQTSTGAGSPNIANVDGPVREDMSGPGQATAPSTQSPAAESDKAKPTHKPGAASSHAPASASISQGSGGPCSGNFANVNGGVTVNCQLVIQQLQDKAKDAGKGAYFAVRGLFYTQSGYMFPALMEYESDPTPDMWAELRTEVGRVKTALDAAIDADAAYQATQPEGTTDALADIRPLLRSRSVAISQFELQEQPMTVEQVKAWAANYRALMEKLKVALKQFDVEATATKQ